jgi:hypothetical protein
MSYACRTTQTKSFHYKWTRGLKPSANTKDIRTYFPQAVQTSTRLLLCSWPLPLFLNYGSPIRGPLSNFNLCLYYKNYAVILAVKCSTYCLRPANYSSVMDVTFGAKSWSPVLQIIAEKVEVVTSICEVHCSSPGLVKTILCQVYENFLILRGECQYHAFMYITIVSFQIPVHA